MTSIVEILTTAPAQLEAQNLLVIQAETDLKRTRAKLNATRSAYTLKHKDAKNAALLDALVESEEEVQRLVLEEIEKDAAAKIAKNKAAAIENQWISSRKLASLSEEEVRAASGASILSHA